MKTLNDYFDAAKDITGSDRQTALRIGVAPNRISMARKNGEMGNEFCTKIAQVIDCDPMEVIAAAEIKKHPEKAEFWGRWVAATVIMSVAAGHYYSLESVAYETLAFTDLYIMRICG